MVSTPQSDPYHSYFRCLLRASPCRRRRGTVLLRLRRGGRRDAGRAYPEPRTQEEAGPGGKTDRELPGPCLGIRGMRLFKNKAGHVVKAKPDFRQIKLFDSSWYLYLR